MSGPPNGSVTIERGRAADRIRTAIEELSGPAFTSAGSAICRYAYTPEYRRTLQWLARRFQELGFQVWEDPLGTFVAQNRPAGTPVFGIGSHCDSVRSGGRWDGTLGVVVALEVCRLAQMHGLDLPLRVISFLEEEGSGFGQVLLGSRVCAGRVTEAELRRGFTAIDDGRTFWEHAGDAGYEPERWRECARVLDDLIGWIECHIEQGRVLQDAGDELGIVDAIAGYVHGDIDIDGRADHAGATPMSGRVDALAAAAEVTLRLEQLARGSESGAVGSVGELQVSPGLINVIPGHVRMSIDVRGAEEDAVRAIADDVGSFAVAAAKRRGAEARYRERQSAPPTPMDAAIVRSLEIAAGSAGARCRRMLSGAVHDTVFVATRVPSGMVFVPCRDGISHSPDEDADPTDAALASEVILNAIATLTAAGVPRGGSLATA